MNAERTSTTSSLKPEGEYHRGLVRACPCVIWNGDYNYKSIPSRDWLIAAGELTANHANIRFAGIPSSSEVLGIFEHAIGDDHDSLLVWAINHVVYEVLVEALAAGGE